MRLEIHFAYAARFLVHKPSLQAGEASKVPAVLASDGFKHKLQANVAFSFFKEVVGQLVASAEQIGRQSFFRPLDLAQRLDEMKLCSRRGFEHRRRCAESDIKTYHA